jgi:succinoglycan biosynthesis transport protein ExoP
MAIVQAGPLGFDSEGLFGNINLLHTLRRRKWIGLAVGFVGVCGAVAIALMWPPIYQSTATILIEEPDVPRDLVKSTVSTYADQRLQVIEQRVMTNQNLSDIIDRFGLFAGALATTPRSELINSLRNKIDLEVLSADFVSSKQRNNQPQATIAFTVSYIDQDPRIAQQVASRITDLYLAENVQTRTEKAAGTTDFLTQQLVRLSQDVQDSEKKLTEFKTKNSGTLPEQVDTNMRILESLQGQLLQNRSQLELLAQRRSFLQSQLGTISPYQPMTAGGMPATPQAQLMSLQLQYLDLSAKYGPKHPTVVHLQKQIDALKAEVGTSDAPTSTQATLSQLQAQLAEALQRYGEKHPTVQKLRKQLDDLQAEIAKQPTSTSMISAPQGPPDNPMYIQMQNQLGEITAQVQGLQMEMADLQARSDAMQQRVLQTQAMSGEYDSLRQQYEAAVKRFQDFKDKEADAQVAQSMEQQSKSETFSVIEAPEFPDLPIKPNRKLLLVAGVVLSSMLAAAAMLALEMLDSKVYEPRGLQMVFGEVPLATVPYITTPRERAARWIKRGAIVLAGIAAIGGTLLAVHTLYMPLDVLWAAFINRINP